MSASPARRLRILLIGPRPRAGEPIGGTQVSFAELCENFSLSGRFDLDVVDTTRPHSYSRGWKRATANATNLASTLLAVLRRGPSADVVMFNASTQGVLAAGPWLQRAARWIGRPFVLRAFGGSLDLAYDECSLSKRERLRDLFRRSDLVLLQTEQLRARFGDCGTIRKLPTTRRHAAQRRSRTRECRSFAFVSQLRPEKGYDDALRAIELCPPHCTLDIYGPSLPTTDLRKLRSHPRAVYHGALPHEHVGRVLAGHDALLFPSYYEGEGLPGVVVEAMQCGLPVVATQWRALPELVENEVNGLLVPPKSPAALAAAMTRMANDRELYAELCIGAIERGRELEASSWHRRLEDWLLELCPRPAQPVGASPEFREVSP